MRASSLSMARSSSSSAKAGLSRSICCESSQVVLFLILVILSRISASLVMFLRRKPCTNQINQSVHLLYILNNNKKQQLYKLNRLHLKEGLFWVYSMVYVCIMYNYTYKNTNHDMHLPVQVCKFITLGVFLPVVQPNYLGLLLLFLC